MSKHDPAQPPKNTPRDPDRSGDKYPLPRHDPRTRPTPRIDFPGKGGDEELELGERTREGEREPAAPAGEDTPTAPDEGHAEGIG